MGFFTSPDGDGFTGDDYDQQAPIMEAEPGTFTQLPAGMSFEAFDPAHPTTAFAEFEKAICGQYRQAWASVSIAVQQLRRRQLFVNTAGTIEDRDHFKMMQNSWSTISSITSIGRGWKWRSPTGASICR